jgi:hypothetical protein
VGENDFERRTNLRRVGAAPTVGKVTDGLEADFDQRPGLEDVNVSWRMVARED